MKMFLPPGNEIRFNSQVPKELARFKAPGSFVNSARGEYGALLLQGLPPNDIKAWHSALRVTQDTSIIVTSPTNGHGALAKMRIIIKSNQLMEIEGLGDIFIQEGEANIIYAPNGQFTHYYKKAKEYISLDLFFPHEQLSKWRSLFPALEQFVTRIENLQPALLTDKSLRITASIFSIIHDIIHCQYDQPYHHLFYENKASLLLFLLLVQTIEPVKDTWHLEDNSQINSILQAKSIITNDSCFHYSIPQIAKEVGLNQLKLKKGFKQVFGVGLYGFLLKIRMEKAKEMLELTSQPVKDISSFIGYQSTSSFIKVFKKRYGHSPYAWRRLQKNRSNSNGHSRLTEETLATIDMSKTTRPKSKGNTNNNPE
jgi:AraC family transcriptional regulator, transcriptional activator of the genes for pyochelin and ferripyochelin receptors